WDTIEKIKHVRGIEIGNPYRDIPLDDKKTYEMLARGESIGVFQYECLAGETLVSLPDGSKAPISLLHAEQPATLISVDPKTRECRENKVLKVIESGEKQLYRLITHAGYELRATAEHQIMTADGAFKRLADL